MALLSYQFLEYFYKMFILVKCLIFFLETASSIHLNHSIISFIILFRKSYIYWNTKKKELKK
ncbi:hypothetical protein GLOIN_2v222537 [Rhizophagus irregularis DAOM 181602=DAOM 197198]|uniref:Uncharacterized protein n=1 Tax=Rhizophagus irregularis (strain DAOM 181602 / DAOM 197198 / MUCL 43194) TaxID=747089 RepID=A0A2P4QT83_RHIID|nr:hypothetical protein GLOIN_2v222537 [Rhizophagus irregularis DAOM 181602=DAOM 197198]POG80822.1 hypothetical protein GLOIN_2v222537 [Rhizophagus irregularis DAOM 181602=DAOM 197198]|eukprot:XP_025187688.1 hypothetical protein GLOIN_2v222537 [Rhizophagus irregularis DAOM 181602=DAOM 197198]